MTSGVAKLMRFLQPAAPFIVAAWAVAAWLIFKQTPGGFLSLFITVPVSFLQMGLLGLMLWLRPSVRLQSKYTPNDLLWYLDTFVLWLIGTAIPGSIGGLLQVAAFVSGVIGGARISRVSQDENLTNMRNCFEGGSPTRPEPGNWGQGRVITIDTTTVRSDGDAASGAEIEIVDGEIVDDRPRSGRDGEQPEQWNSTPHGD